jgi:hypothetical protein
VASKKTPRSQWYRVDLHLHTPASLDYKDKHASYLDILHRAEYRGIDAIAFTDHNTVNGYVGMMREIERLEYLEQTARSQPEEARQLLEYRRLLDKILVLPGFEFTATFGFHVLGIFAPHTPLRLIEHILLSLNVPFGVLETGDGAAGSTADVLDAYRLIDEAGGIAIAAHINAAHGVMMRGLNFGGQTRIAYTQDRHLAALELTDMHNKGRGSTRRFFDGTKAEYPRRMHLLQGSDAHSLDSFMEGKNMRFGVGERVTEMNLRDRSFEAIKELLEASDFSRTRPYNADRTPYDFVQAAREEGETLMQSFHETLDNAHLGAIVADVCAFANTNGGTIYVGIDSNRNKKPVGIIDVPSATATMQNAINRMITPPLDVDIDTQESLGKTIIRVQIPYGEERPYAVNDNQIYVRDDDGETSLAVRDEIVNLVRQGLIFEQADLTATSANATNRFDDAEGDDDQDEIAPPRAGVEIDEVEDRNETLYFTMRDLRNGNIVKNVTLDSARRLWHYAIKQYTGNPFKATNITWHGDIGMIRRYEKGGDVRYDLVQKDGEKMRVYYGVTKNGMHGQWETFVPLDET